MVLLLEIGYAAYDKVDIKYLEDRLKVFLPTINIRYTM